MPYPSSPSPSPSAGKLFRQCINRFYNRACRKEEKLLTNLEACKGASLLRRKGEALKAGLHNVKRGMASIALPDYAGPDPEALLEIELDLCRPPREMIQRFFKQASRLERGRDHIQQEITINRTRIKELESLLKESEEWLESGEDLKTIPASLMAKAKALHLPVESDQAYVDTFRPKPTPKEELRLQQMRSVRVFTSTDGLEIFVGKSNVDNDILTFRLARGNDWWFHLAPAAGSHVVVRNPSGDALPQETLLDAATLAVYYSKMRSADRAEVHYTQAKNVRRIKGAPPGKVSLERNQTLCVRIEESRLQRLVHSDHPSPSGRG